MEEKILNFLKKSSNSRIYEFIVNYFNDDKDAFIKFLFKSGIKSNSDIMEKIFNLIPLSFIKFLYKKDPETSKTLILNFFSDVTSSNGKYYLTLNEMEDLAEFFKDDSRDFSSRDLAEKILSEDMMDDFFYDTMQNIYTDVIEELNTENLKTLSILISDSLNDIGIEPSTDTLVEIAEKQGHPDYAIVTPENLMNEIFDDERSTKAVLEEVPEIESDLSSLFNSSYNHAYFDEKWQILLSEIKNLFGSENIGEDTSKTISLPNGKNTLRKQYTIECTNLLNEVIDAVLDSDYLDDEDNIFEYEGSLQNVAIRLINEGYLEGASMQIPYYDYPDSNLVTKALNEGFGDYFQY